MSTNQMVSVDVAQEMILNNALDFGNEWIHFEDCNGRVLAEDLTADRDMPPFNRVTMDGIACHFEAIQKGIRSFLIKGVQAAGDLPIEQNHLEACIEIMTGAALPESANCVIPYEQLSISNGVATLKNDVHVQKGQNIHVKGKDKKAGDVLVQRNQYITPSVINTLAAIGKTSVLVKKKPKVIIISTGDELVAINQLPNPTQIRRSSNYALWAGLKEWGIEAAMQHLPDDVEQITKALNHCLNEYDVVLLTGGVSMGKFDYVPQVLEDQGVQKLFHKVQQKPGKPFWFGLSEKRTAVFAFPGNPVSTFLCFHRYFVPWLRACWSIPNQEKRAILDVDYTFLNPMTHFLLVKLLLNEKGELRAIPSGGNGSGDFSSLLEADAFVELPSETDRFYKGDVVKIWSFNNRII